MNNDVAPAWEVKDRLLQKWHPTPRWAFWRPAWRRLDPGGWGEGDRWIYQTNRQRARKALEEQYGPRSDRGIGAAHP